MSYHKFANLREIFQHDLSSKLTKGLQSKDFMDHDCNCQSSNKDENDLCIYKGKCRRSIVVYKATCLICSMPYIGNTQQQLKARMDQHFGDVVKLVNKGDKSDSFASHFAKHFSDDKKDVKVKRKDVRSMVKMDILWQGNPISCMKTFGQLNCRLCM